ncbi:hypothetical protein KBT16_23600 [Nostoc sp. CCCryo 231-06]|nr:hypothetical protein [Nostoc sp. CCCryo 231-06]
MLFSQTKVTGLFCFENRKTIFEEVDSRFKFVVITFVKGSITTEFPSAFMRHDVQELQRFPSDDSLQIKVDMVRQLSPDSLSVMEFKNQVDIRIAEKMLKFPLLGEKIEGKWNLRLTAEFHMTSDSNLFKQQPAKGRLPLYEGKMIHQFTHLYAEPRYWVDEQEGRKALLGRRQDKNQKLNYQTYRLAYRSVAASTNERSLIASVLPPNILFGHSMNASIIFDEERSDRKRIINSSEVLFVIACLNSFLFDFLIRQRISQNLTMFYIYQLPVPRLTKNDRNFNDIVQRAAKLICTTPEFDELAQEVGLVSHHQGVTDETERAKLRAELDGMVAHLYGLTEDEFSYILTTFPIVNATVKEAALSAYRNFAPMFGESKILASIE